MLNLHESLMYGVQNILQPLRVTRLFLHMDITFEVTNITFQLSSNALLPSNDYPFTELNLSNLVKVESCNRGFMSRKCYFTLARTRVKQLYRSVMISHGQ